MNLIPDATVFFQIIIFLVVMVVLQKFVFKPTLKILDKRREKTLGLQKETEKILADAEIMDREYNEKISAARIEGLKLEQELIGAGENEAQKIIALARQEELSLISKAQERILKEGVLAKQELGKNIGDFAQMIVAKILGKK